MSSEIEPSVLSELRSATRALHAALDSRLSLLEGPVSKERYAAFLRGSLFALTPIEAALSRWLSEAANESRSALIRADLRALDCEVPAYSAEHTALRIESVAQAFGARYVIEGSALGGAVLARGFQHSLALEPSALQFLTQHGAQLGEHWRAFIAELEAWGKIATALERSQACATAIAVFDLYVEAFERAGAYPNSHDSR